MVAVVGFWSERTLPASNGDCFTGSLTWLHSRASEPVLLLAAAARLWPSMDLLPWRACEAAGAFLRLGKLFVLTGAMFVGCKSALRAFTRWCCCFSRQRRRELIASCSGKVVASCTQKNCFERKVRPETGEADQMKPVAMQKAAQSKFVKQRPDGLQLARSAEVVLCYTSTAYNGQRKAA